MRTRSPCISSVSPSMMCTAPDIVDAGGPDGDQTARAIAPKSRSEGPKREGHDRPRQGEP